jgi:hypothetical protein
MVSILDVTRQVLCPIAAIQASDVVLGLRLPVETIKASGKGFRFA